MTFFENLFDFLKFASHFSSVLLTINMVLFIFLALKSKEKVITILALYLTTIFFVQNYGAWLAFNETNNIFGTHYYFILQLLLLAYFYYEICKLNIQKKTIQYSTIGCLVVLTIQYSLKPELYFKFNELEVFLCSYLLIVFTLFHYYNILGFSKKFLMFNTGLFVYLFGSTMLFLLGNLFLILKLGNISANLNRWIYTVYQCFVLFEGIYLLKAYNLINLNFNIKTWKMLRMQK